MLSRTQSLKRSPMVRKPHWKKLRNVSKRRSRELCLLRESSLVVRKRSGGRCEMKRWMWPPLSLGEDFSLDREPVMQQCEFVRCNQPVTISPHHIKPRSKGIDHSPKNLLDLCFDCHRWVHDHPKEAKELGVLK